MSWNKVWMPEFDEEHQQLFQIVEAVNTAMHEGALLRAMEPQLRSLIGHVEKHFSHEEKKMRAARYPLYAWHRKQHDGVRRKVAALVRSVEQGDGEAVLPALEYLAGWLRDHTGVTDRMMASYLRNRSRTA